MKYCGIDLKGSEAIIACIQASQEGNLVIAKAVKKIALKDPDDQASLKAFAEEFRQFFKSHAIDQVGIKARLKKGKFAGGPTSFKMEAIIQCLDHPVQIIPGPTLKAKFKNTPVDSTEVNGYQEDALKVATYLAMTT